MILLIDNYDSFSYNLYQMIGAIEPDIKVIRNDEMTIKQIEELRKGIMEVSSKEAPYDIFICYKEADENGESRHCKTNQYYGIGR